MTKIQLELNRQESYCLLAATECLRQLLSKEDEGIPLIASIQPVSTKRKYTQVNFFLGFGNMDFTLDVRVNAGNRWPRRGTVLIIPVEVGAGGFQYQFRLEGDPDSPKVVFTTMRGGG